MQFQDISDRTIQRRWNAKRLAEFNHTATQPIELEPFALFEVGGASMRSSLAQGVAEGEARVGEIVRQ